MRIVEVPIDKIKRDVNQPRTNFDPATISNMAASIRTEGVINAVEIDRDFVIITGECRVRACKEAGFKTVPCKIMSVNPRTRFRRQVIENIHSPTMTDMDTANALDKLLKDFFVPTVGTLNSKKNRGAVEDKGYQALAKLIGKDHRWVGRYFALLESSTAFKRAVKEGIPLSFIDVINAAPKEFKKEIERKVITGEFGTRDGARMVVGAIKARPDKAKELLSKDYSGMQTAKVAQTVYKIVPDFSETPETAALAKAFEPSEEISGAANKLIVLLDKYTIADMGGFNIPRVAMALEVLHKKTIRWMQGLPTKPKLLDN